VIFSRHSVFEEAQQFYRDVRAGSRAAAAARTP
jgi:hypothetical protein